MSEYWAGGLAYEFSPNMNQMQTGMKVQSFGEPERCPPTGLHHSSCIFTLAAGSADESQAYGCNASASLTLSLFNSEGLAADIKDSRTR